MKELVSVIITTHNRKEGLKKAIKSVLDQTYDNLECIVIDDASETKYAEIKQDFRDQRIKYEYITKEESRGGNYARNKGLMIAEGEYIAFLDDDDEWLSNKLEKQIEVFKRSGNIGLVYCGSFINYYNTKRITTIALPSKEYRGNLNEKVFERIFCRTSMIMTKRSVLNDVGVFDDKLKYWQEYDLVIRICQKYNVEYVDEALVYILQEVKDVNRLSNKFEEWKENLKYFEGKHAVLINHLNKETYNKWKSLIYYDAANRCEINGNRKLKKEYLWKSWVYDKKMYKFIIAFFNLKRRNINKLREIKDSLERVKCFAK